MPRSANDSPRSVLRHDLRCILGDGAAFSVMVGIGETYVPAFVLALGLGEVAAGMVATVPMLVGSVLQLVSPWALHRVRSFRWWVVVCALCQAASLLLLPVTAWVGSSLGWLVFVAATVYWATGLATGPAWNTWIEALVPRRIRARFFAARVRINQFGVVFGFVAGGVILQYGKALSQPVWAFAVLFLVAGVCRFVSGGFLASQSEPAPGIGDEPNIGLRALLERLPGHAGVRLLSYVLAVQAAVYIAAPFFTPYMLAQLELSYLEFVALTATAFISRILVMPSLGRLAERAGPARLLWIGGLAITPLPALWLVSPNFYYLLILQFVAGIAWAAYELAMFLMFFESIPRAERTSMLTLYNLGNSAAMVAGTLFGALVLKLAGARPATYLLLFGLSALARVFALVFLIRVPAVRFEVVRPATRTMAIRPSNGAISQPILPSMPDDPTTIPR